MNFFDGISIAAQRAQDFNLPVHAWPTFIENEAVNVCLRNSDAPANSDWD
jgi:hypothetical protein